MRLRDDLRPIMRIIANTCYTETLHQEETRSSVAIGKQRSDVRSSGKQMANDLVTWLTARNRHEMRYVSDMLCMHRERYRVYCSDLAAARKSGDAQRTRELLHDLTQFVGEIDRLVNKQRSVNRRSVGLNGTSVADVGPLTPSRRNRC